MQCLTDPFPAIQTNHSSRQKVELRQNSKIFAETAIGERV